MVMAQKVIFLDRDGVINRDSPDYIKSWSEFEFLPGSLTGLRRLTVNGFTIIIITNQSIIGRKMVPREVLGDIHARMTTTIEANGGKISKIFYCPHTPEDDCDCRKPKPGLIYQAQSACGIDLPSATMIGDSVKDIECAQNSGCGCTILVKTGNGVAAERSLRDRHRPPDHILADLNEATLWVVGNDRRLLNE